MAVLSLPVRSDFKSYTQQIDLNGTVFTLRFQFNTRWGRWIMHIEDSIGTEICNGVPLQTNIALTDQFISDLLPLGRFIAIDETGEDKDAGEDDLGNDVKLLYEEAS